MEILTLSDIHEGNETPRSDASVLETPYDAITFLSRALSTNSVISTSSSLAKRYEAAQAASTTTHQYHSIGSGQCGRVFAYAGDPWVVKRANSSPLPLWTEYEMHLKVQSAAEDNPDVAALCAIIPEAKCYIKPENQAWWDVNLAKFPQEYQFPAELLVSRYIRPLPEPVRLALIEQFCPERMREFQTQVSGNRDCLARVYLGKKSNPRPSRFFTLRNFALFHDRMDFLGLELDMFASKMANTMALLHFGACMDGRDVEFVLGSRAEPIKSPRWQDFKTFAVSRDTLSPSASVEPGPLSYCRRRVEMFVLDFNQCCSIEMTKEGMESAAEAFLVNDPYFPRPHTPDEANQKLWGHFCQVYRGAAERVAGRQLGKERTGVLVDWFLESIDSRVRVRHSIGLETG